MNRVIFAAALMAVSIMFSGCAMKNIEAQAYAVSLGIDLANEESIRVSVQVPALNQGGGSESGGESGGGGSGYTFSQAEGKTLTAALEMLNAGVPRELNLTGVKSIVVSEKLAQSDALMDALEELALAYRVYGAAEIVICEGEAGKFIENQQPVIGLRLSESTTVALSHYQETGYIPSAKAADVFYLTHSFYGDPAVILAAGSEGEGEMSAGKNGDSYAENLPDVGEKQNRYFGAALLREGRMVGKLTGTQTQLLNALLGDIEYFSWVVENVPVRINIAGRPQIKADLSGEHLGIDVKLTVNMMDSEGTLEPDMLKREMEARLVGLTEYCQACGVDPFRYAETAARQFTTVDEWLDYDWHGKFGQAEIRYEVEVRRTEL